MTAQPAENSADGKPASAEVSRPDVPRLEPGGAARIAALRAELEASGADRPRQAILQHEIGRIIEVSGGGEAMAVREYLGAYNLDPTFRPPLFELVRIFERRRSFKNLARLYEAELKSATTPAERASALVDRGSLLEDHLGVPDQAGPLFEQAAAADPESIGALLMLERRARAAGDRTATEAIVVARAEHTRSPELKTLLSIEVARGLESSGEVDAAVDALRRAARVAFERGASRPAAERARPLLVLEELARKHGRALELVAALESRAAIEAADEETRVDATVSYLEAARVRNNRIGDPDAARATLEKALALAPESIALRRAHMLAAESAGDLAAAAEDAVALVALAGTGGTRAPLHLRVAEAAQGAGDVDGARAALAAALEEEPGSAVLRAMSEDLARALGEVGPLVEALTAQAEALSPGGVSAPAGDRAAAGDARAAVLARAASLVETMTGETARASELLRAASESASDPAVFLHELLALATLRNDAALLLDATNRLLSFPTDAEEKAALHHARFVAMEGSDAPLQDQLVALDTAIEAGSAWAMERLRILAAASDAHAPLARAHEGLAARAADGDTAAAHFVAAARAHARAGETDLATAALRAALAKAPGHRYAVALLEEIYRQKGDADAVVRILREAAEADQSGRAMQAQLLVAGAAAEAAGDLDLAVRTYQEALDRDPTSPAPLFMLRSLAGRKGDAALELRALEALADHELAAGAPSAPAAEGAPSIASQGRFNLELGEHYLAAGDASAAGPRADLAMRAALDAKETRIAAALDLALVSPAASHLQDARLEALGILMAHAVGPARIAFAHELLSEAQIRGDAALAAPALAVLETGSAAGRERDPLARLAAVGRTAGDPAQLSARARAGEAHAECMDDALAAAELTLHATRIDLLTSTAESDAVLTAASLADSAPGSVAAAIAAVEALGDEDDMAERADALGAWAPHASGATASSILAGQARLLGLSQRTEEALPILRTLIEADPDDLASFESLRVVARAEEAWGLVVLACDRLAREVDGELRAQLLEEAAATLMDHVDDDEGAETRLRAALAQDPTRPIAYARLHDVLADRSDEQGLVALVGARIEVTDDPVDLAPLFYEHARLYRSLGDYEGALASLENLLLFESEHLGGLALLVEIHVQREQFRDAVDALRQIATAQEVPASQRRIARLGAADFLDRKLDDAVGALAELRAVEELGLGDRALFERVAGLAERLGDLDRASEALERGAEVERDLGKRAAVERRLARLELSSRGRREHALAAYRRALRALPTDLESLEAASALIADSNERASLSEGPELAFRGRLATDALDADALHALVRVGDSRGDRVLGVAASRALVALGLATPSEAALAAPDARSARAPLPSPALSDAHVSLLLASPTLALPAGGALMDVALATVETLVEADRLEPGTFGLARGDIGKVGSPLVDEVLAIAAKLGAPAGDVYVGGRDGALVTVIPSYKGKPAWVLGADAGSLPAGERRFRIGALAFGLRLGLGPLATRALAGGSDEVCRALFGAAAAASAPLAAGEAFPGVADSARVLGKAIGRRARRTIAEAAPKIGEAGVPLIAWARSLTVSLARAGMLVGGDPVPALKLAGLERGASGALDPRSVISFWVAADTLAMRRELGLAS